MVDGKHTFGSYLLRLVCIIMLLLVQFDVVGCVISNYNGIVIELIEHSEDDEDESEHPHVSETYYRYGTRIACSAPQILEVLIPDIVVSNLYIIPCIPAKIKYHSLQAHAVYCVFLI